MSFESIVQGGGVVTQQFGDTSWACNCRCEWTCPGHPPGCFHAGLDIAASGSNRLLLAAGYGQVVRIGRQTSGCGGLGPYAPCIRTGGVDIWYGHAKQCLVGAGTQVVPGQAIAVMGSIGCSTGQHVHFEVLPAGADPNGCGAIDPWAYISKWPSTPCPPGMVGPAYGQCSCAPGFVPRNDGSGLCDPAPPRSHLGAVAVLAGAAALLYAASRTSPKP